MQRSGITLTNIIAIIVCVVVVCVLVVTILPPTLSKARIRKDQAQLKEIVAAFAVYAESDREGRFPVPGEIKRDPIDTARLRAAIEENTGNTIWGCIIWGSGKSDSNINLSGWLHSYMVGSSYYEPHILISASETNRIVVAKGDNKNNPSEIPYDYPMVDPSIDSYWDPLFSGDISGQGRAEGTVQGGVAGVCHTSYANMALCGERLKYWKSGDHRTVIMSSRGPEDGANIGDDFTKSPTLKLYGDASKWEGIYVNADGAVHYADSMWFEGIMYKPLDSEIAIPDSAFYADFRDYENTDSLGNTGGASADTWMVLNIASTATDVKTAWDTLLP